MAFEQNQQDGLNLGTGFDQVKQFQAELDKATASIGAAELAAEENQFGLKLKNLEALQKARVRQLDRLIAMEEAGIRELARLKLTLSKRQFAVRKNEIQREFQLAKAAAEGLYKAENKRKQSTKAQGTTKKITTTEDISATAKNKATKAAVNESNNATQSELIKVLSSLDSTLVSLQDTIATYGNQQKEALVNAISQPTQPSTTENVPASAANAPTERLTPNINITVEPAKAAESKIEASQDRQFSDSSKGLKEVDLGEYSFGSIKETFDELRIYLGNNANTNASILADLNNLIASEGQENQTSQTSVDFAGELLKNSSAARETEEALLEFRKDAETLALNRRLLAANQEQKVRLGYLAEYQELLTNSFSHLTENMTAAEFKKLRAETAATEKAIKARSKAYEAFDKAFAAQKSKGTLTEKKQLIEAIVKERAAEKDWSNTKYKTTDGMSDKEKAEIQRKRENAVKAEMAINAAMGALANFAQQLMQQTDKIGAKQAPIDTRLQGSTVNDKILGSYWKQLARDMNKIGAVNPYFKQEDFASNIEALVNRGISFDIKQRAFLMTIQEKIANTFDVADGTLLRLVRIQQQDTTAGRLGMESALNSFLNSMYETSEYLTDVASSVRGSLEEMQALMEGAAGTELEFQVQKWMGSLYSVGMSQDAVQSIAQTFGQIASGDVGGLTGSGASNLLIMAANEAGMSIADILQDGLNADDTNKLMQAMVNYLAEIAEMSSDSRVVQQQLANVFGVRASDLKAATNLASSIKDVSNQDLTYSGMLGQLNKMANSMYQRTSTGEMLSNVWGNVQYTMATQMSNDPILYLLPRIATLLEETVGGIDLPSVNVRGFGVDLNTSVAQLMNVAAMSGSVLGALGPMISGLASIVSGNAMLSLAGINTSGKAPVIARGSAQPLQHLGGTSISESGYIGNSSGEDIKNATLQDAEDSKKSQMVEARDDESSDDIVNKSQQAIIDIYNLLEEVAHGSQSLRVRLVNNAGSPVSLGSNEGAVAPSTTPGAGVNSGDNGNWVLAF